MAITNLISGELRNKVGGMVGAKWKGKSYVRSYVIPKNPKTADQVSVRTTFALLTQMGAQINEPVLKLYQAKPVKNRSPYNVFVALNKTMVEGYSIDPLDIKIFNGPLPLGTAVAGDVVQADGEIVVTITPATYGLAEATDVLIVTVWNQTKNTFNTITDVRGTGADVPITVPIPTTTADVLYWWATCAKVGSYNGPTVAGTKTVATA
jgi:hypothetical protein